MTSTTGISLLSLPKRLATLVTILVVTPLFNESVVTYAEELVPFFQDPEGCLKDENLQELCFYASSNPSSGAPNVTHTTIIIPSNVGNLQERASIWYETLHEGEQLVYRLAGATGRTTFLESYTAYDGSIANFTYTMDFNTESGAELKENEIFYIRVQVVSSLGNHTHDWNSSLRVLKGANAGTTERLFIENFNGTAHTQEFYFQMAFEVGADEVLRHFIVYASLRDYEKSLFLFDVTHRDFLRKDYYISPNGGSKLCHDPFCDDVHNHNGVL
ncbi:hypothetical protein FOL47_000492 [Perkinsus chesapeaki]|uniref:Uncharacterized protein n=1 Tax=Perkinsus chesapeaki TaxID=330153 RepID=A0A7J6KXZ7_PERCH|nr:hypothetical protein FOL47_000492 [Perkinsus chesapeaki]